MAGKRGRGQAARAVRTWTGAAVLAGTMGELMLASARTIGARTAMMAEAAGDPVGWANPEFSLMGREKVTAFAAAGDAVASGYGALQDAWASWIWGQAGNTVTAMAALGRCRTPMEAVAVQRRYAERTAANAAAAGAKLAEAGVRLAGAGVAPIHKVAAANAKRLGRRRP